MTTGKQWFSIAKADICSSQVFHIAFLAVRQAVNSNTDLQDSRAAEAECRPLQTILAMHLKLEANILSRAALSLFPMAQAVYLEVGAGWMFIDRVLQDAEYIQVFSQA